MCVCARTLCVCVYAHERVRGMEQRVFVALCVVVMNRCSLVVFVRAFLRVSVRAHGEGVGRV